MSEERDAFGNPVRPRHEWLANPQVEHGDPLRSGPADEAQPEDAPGAIGFGHTSGKATAALALGILGLVFFPVLASIPAIVLGVQARREIRASGGRLGGSSQALVGIVLGSLVTAVFALFAAVVALFFVLEVA